MEKMAQAFVSEIFAQFTKGFLDLLAAPRRRVSVGLDCEPWAESDPSILTESPWAIARAIVMAIMVNERFDLPQLMVIPGLNDPPCLARCLASKPSSRISAEKKARGRSLSATQFFMGLYESPRAAFLNSVHGHRTCGCFAEAVQRT
jgi:hypothetical protein